MQSQATIDQITVGFFFLSVPQVDLHKTSPGKGNMYAQHLKNILILIHFV